MVDKRIIEDIIKNKCSNSEIKNKLSVMSDEEKYIGLKDKLNSAEIDHYNTVTSRLEMLKETIREYEEEVKKDPNSFFKNFLSDFKKQQKELEKILFDYDKRIFNGYRLREEKQVTVDESRFEIDDDFVDEDVDNFSLGRIEEKNVDNQNFEFKNGELSSINSYFHSAYELLNSKLNNGKRWNNLSKSERDSRASQLNTMDKHLSNVINSSKGLVEDTVLYRNGRFDVSLIVGDRIKFKGYTSTSFQKHVAEDWDDTMEIDENLGSINYVYKILAPKGTKGICANDKKYELTTYPEEHEYLLGKDLEATIVDVDSENHIVTIAL